ncbi:MAG TPA: OmpA family protein [Candidatus Eisenbacteria bacterium]|nr:OmpA family protein [Candidatus Eisenbacteria bacterium]
MRPFVLAALALTFAVAASANPLPKNLAHVDPKAPCFRWPAVDYDGDGVFDRLDYCNDTPKGCTVDARGCPTDADQDGVCDGLDQCPDTPKGEKVDAHGCSESQRGARPSPREVKPRPEPQPVAPPVEEPQAQPQRTESERELLESGRIRIQNVHFATNRAEILPESRAALDEAGQALEKYPQLRVEVEGHTDTRGAADYNMRLSAWRARAVREYLLQHFHLDPGRLTARGYGETQPETQERTAEERFQDRRVVLRVLNPEALPKNVEIERH